ncbi:MAG: SDR family oxidoreductase [Deltaproteobacteria bacterium]|nr:SDR family oxidoreductase [Deltaproteobacteria bacterium]MBW2726983.1 SDR family oxidoreductase [Deltaproteobacteria bacterium]
MIVTGAASGIGRAIALRLAEEGARVGIFDLNRAGAEETATAIHAAEGTASAHEVDIANYDAVARAVADFEANGAPVAGLVNNAGWDLASPFLDTNPEQWKKLIDINLLGPINVTKIVLAGMSERGHGRIVNIASDAGRVGSSGESVYAACKGGVIALTKSVAREMARSGITLNCVSPGPSDTPLFADFDPSGKLAKALERAIPMRRLGQPEDYPGIVAFLLSDEAAYITGQTISVSGGLTMHG